MVCASLVVEVVPNVSPEAYRVCTAERAPNPIVLSEMLKEMVWGVLDADAQIFVRYAKGFPTCEFVALSIDPRVVSNPVQLFA